MNSLINIIVFVLVLGSIIFIHELGHFVAAKSFGVYCSEFSLGMGPKLLSKKGKETEYCLRALPVGGFVAMYGEVDQENNDVFSGVDPQRSLKNIKTWQKVTVMLAGVIMNFIMAFAIIFAVYATQPTTVDVPVIGTVAADYPAQQAGLVSGDVITAISVAGETLEPESYSEMVAFIQSFEYDGDATLAITFSYQRDGTSAVTDVMAIYNEDTGVYQIGVTAMTDTMSVTEAFSASGGRLWYISTTVLDTFGRIITGDSQTISQVSGPVGIFNITSQVREQGATELLMVVALLSANIGVFNLLPIPGLDGSQVIFALIERAIGREIPINIRYGLQLVGLALVFGLMIFITINDITKLFN